MPNAAPIDPPVASARTPLKSLVALVLGIFSVLYLLNFGAGFIEFIPDNIPIIGNLDEVAATILLLRCLSYFGLNVSHLIGGLQRREKNITPPGDTPR